MTARITDPPAHPEPVDQPPPAPVRLPLPDPLGDWHLFTVFERSPDPFVALRAVRDHGGRIRAFSGVWANGAAAQLTGIAPEALAGRSLRDAFPGVEAPDRLHQALGDAVEQDEPCVQIVRFQRDGTVRWLRIAATPVGGDRVAAVITDVTGQRTAGEELAESEERFRLLVESWAQAVWEADPDGMTRQASPSWRAYTGQSVEEQLGDGWADATHPDDREFALRQWQHAVGAGRPLNAVFRIRRGKSWRWTNVRAAPVVDADGRIRKWVGMNIDVTAAREARDELRRSEERLRLAMEVAGLATFDRELETGRTHWSPTLARIVGEPAATALHGLASYVHPDDAPAVAAAQLETLRSDRPYRYEHRIVTVGGDVRWVAVHGQTIFESSEGRRRAVRSIGVVVDVTEQRRETEIRDVFVGMLSHELRTPVTAIYGGSQMLLRSTLTEEIRAEIVADISSESDRMRRLVENLLVLAKVERRAELGVPVPVALHPIVERAVADERRRAPGAWIVVDAAPGLPAVLGDEAAVELAVVNLISNAVKYGPPAGLVRVALRREGEHVAVRILDEGPGLPAPEEAGQLFELFYRSQEARRNASGAGIGLYVARALIEGVGGRIWARDRPEGGAEFGIGLPVVPEADESAA